MEDPAHASRPHPVRTALILAGAFLVLTAVLVRERSGEVGLWDWDTYGRLQFIHHYQPETWLDGHVLYHALMRALMALGLGDVSAVEVVTAAGAAGFLCLLAWICHREQLSRGATALVLAAATLGSPGLVALFLIAEDNVLYLPVVLGVFFVLSRQHADRRRALWRGGVLGVLLATAMLINISLLVMVLALIAAAPLVWLRDRTRALGLLAAVATALVTYHLAHVVPFTPMSGAKLALHEFLPQALRLQDFDQSTTPLLSLDRFEQYRGGLRAIALAPTVHVMKLSPGLATLLLGVLPKLLVVLAACLIGWLVRYRRVAVRAAILAHLDVLAMFGVAVVFPYVYEPFLIERWDVFWVGAVFALVPLFKLAPSRFAIGLVVAMVAVQSVGTVVAIAHHYGRGWADPALAQIRATAHDVTARDSDAVVMPSSIDRGLLADFTHRIGRRTVYLVGDERPEPVCVRLYDLFEARVALPEVVQALRTRTRIYVHPVVSPDTRRALGLGAP